MPLAAIQFTTPLPQPVAGPVYALLAFNGAVILACLALSPRTWTRYLCAWTGHLNTMLVYLGVGCGASGLLQELKCDLTPYIIAFLAVAVELMSLRVISYYRFRDTPALWWPK